MRKIVNGTNASSSARRNVRGSNASGKNGSAKNANAPNVNVAMKKNVAIAGNHFMNLHLLIPTLRQSCSLVLAYHDAGIISEQAAFHIAFDTRSNPQIIFSGHTEDHCPKHIDFSEIIIAGCLHNIADTIAGMGLSHEKGVARMADHILANLHKLLYDITTKDSRILELAGVLDEFAVAGINAGIANSKKTPPKKPAAATCEHPERN